MLQIETAFKNLKHDSKMRRRKICNNTGHGDLTKACTLWQTGFPIHSCVLLMNYRTERSVFFGFHVCDHVFSYSSDYSVVISSACSVLSFDRRQLPEQEKYVVACITTDPEPVT